jgi:hypothetical protein
MVWMFWVSAMAFYVRDVKGVVLAAAVVDRNPELMQHLSRVLVDDRMPEKAHSLSTSRLLFAL